MLPLPIEDRVPFAVHVNSTFSLTNNCCSLKWKAQEQKHDEESNWNNLLLEKYLPSCYVELISKLINIPNIGETMVYSHWSYKREVKDTPWKAMLKPFYSQLFQDGNKILYSPISGGQWISIEDATFIYEEDTINVAVQEAALNCQLKLVELSDAQWRIINKYYKYNV